MATLTDGLGFEELGDASDSAQKTSQLNITGSVVAGGIISAVGNISSASDISGAAFVYGQDVVGTDSVSGLNMFAQHSGLAPRLVGANVIGTTDISGLDVYAQGSVVGGKVETADGALNSNRAEGAFGARIETGSSLTGAEGFGSAIFNAAFDNTQYYFSAQVGSSSTFTADNTGSVVVVISGLAGRGVGSVIFKGAASAPYTWVAIGL